jgi:hypothetical protein
MVIVQYLHPRLPPGFTAAPNVHLATGFEVDVTSFREDDPPEDEGDPSLEEGPEATSENGEGGVATMVWAPPKPTLSVATMIPDQDEYEVRIYDDRHQRTLVAAIEIVSPSNKDRPESRQSFVAKAASLLRQKVCVSIVDLVTVMQFNLYGELLEFIGRSDPKLGGEAPSVYAATLRARQDEGKRKGTGKGSGRRQRSWLDTWYYGLEVGQKLPSLPIWLDDVLGVMLDLEATYEDSCRVLRIS